jgi:hypothetical protein
MRRALLALVLLCSSSIAAGPRPVSVGGNEDLDACPSLSQVGGAKSGMISVRAGPGADYAEIDRLDNGQFVYDCDASGEWSGVVYLRGKEMAPDCGVASPMTKRAPYLGKCKSGWVRTKWLTVVAG